MTVWLILDGPHATSGTYYLSEIEARRVAAARNKALGFADAHPDSRVVRAETVEPAGPPVQGRGGGAPGEQRRRDGAVKREPLGAVAAQAARLALREGRDPVEAAREAVRPRLATDNPMVAVALLNADGVAARVVEREARMTA